MKKKLSLTEKISLAENNAVDFMASLAGLNGISLPSFGSSMDPEDARALRNYLYQLQEQLGYVLTNLDSENMSENFLSSKGETE